MDQLAAMTVTESLDKTSKALQQISSSLRHAIPHYEIDQTCQRMVQALELSSKRQAEALKSVAIAIDNLAKSNNRTTTGTRRRVEHKEWQSLTIRARKALRNLEHSLGELTIENITSANLLNIKNCGADTVERILEWKEGLED